MTRTWEETKAEAIARGVKLHSLPAWAPMTGLTLGRHVFLKIESPVVLGHELVHVEQQRQHPVWFWLSYLILPFPIFWSWRWKWEVEAYRVELEYGATVSGLAEVISGSLYLWPCRRSTAVRALNGDS